MTLPWDSPAGPPGHSRTAVCSVWKQRGQFLNLTVQSWTDEQPHTHTVIKFTRLDQNHRSQSNFCFKSCDELLSCFTVYNRLCCQRINCRSLTVWAEGFTLNTSVTCQSFVVYTSQRNGTKKRHAFSWLRVCVCNNTEYKNRLFSFLFHPASSPPGHRWCVGSGEAWGRLHHSGAGGGCSAAGRRLGRPWGRSAAGGDPAGTEAFSTTRAVKTHKSPLWRKRKKICMSLDGVTLRRSQAETPRDSTDTELELLALHHYKRSVNLLTVHPGFWDISMVQVSTERSDLY